MLIRPFKRGGERADVLVVVVGHEHPDFLADTAQSFDHHNAGSDASYRLVFAVDNDRDCADALASRHGWGAVYCTSEQNGWGRGIARTLVYALDHFQRQGITFDHVLTVDSDTLVLGACLDHFVSLAGPGVSFVGRKWGGDREYSSANPGPGKLAQRQIAYLANLFPQPWVLVDYMVAGPFCLWTRHALDFLREIELMPGSAFDLLYPYILFPHDQLTTFVLGFDGHRFVDAGPSAMIHCGEVGGLKSWKQGLPSIIVQPYGEVPVVSRTTSVIHPIRSEKFDEGKVRAFFRKQRHQ